MKTGQGKFNLSTVADDTSALDQQSDREGNSHTGFFFPEKRFFFFFFKKKKKKNETRPLVFQSIISLFQLQRFQNHSDDVYSGAGRICFIPSH